MTFLSFQSVIFNFCTALAREKIKNNSKEAGRGKTSGCCQKG